MTLLRTRGRVRTETFVDGSMNPQGPDETGGMKKRMTPYCGIWTYGMCRFVGNDGNKV